MVPRVHQSSGEMGPPSQSSLAQLSYAPTVQTTVVTTTTTTTTSFPPFVLKAPRNLNARDPELYPLASTPTPCSLRKIQLNVDGRTAYFEEADDIDQKLKEVRCSPDINDLGESRCLSPALCVALPLLDLQRMKRLMQLSENSISKSKLLYSRIMAPSGR